MNLSELEQPYLESTLVSLDHSESAQSILVRPDRYRQLRQALKASDGAIARGQGLSYALASAGNNVTSVTMTEFNRILGFDVSKQTIEVEAGLELGSLLEFLASRGFWFPVLPGYPTITVGGAIGMNVHGKTQFDDGLFCDHVEELEILHPDHGVIRCNRHEHREVFELTCGGFGLTGVITRARLKVQPLQGGGIRRKRLKAKNLVDAAKLMLDLDAQSYSWNNLNSRDFGNGYVYTETFTDRKIKDAPKRSRLSTSESKIFRLPLIATIAQKSINFVYQAMEQLTPSEKFFGLMTGSFPLNGKEIYFNACASHGFHQYQLIVPHMRWEEFTKKLETLLRENSIFTTLGSLKIFRGNPSLLNFQLEGVCLALDLPRQHNDLAFLSALDELVIACGGIQNIAKDSRLTASVVARAYPGYQEFKDLLAIYDPKRRMRSRLRERLDV